MSFVRLVSLVLLAVSPVLLAAPISVGSGGLGQEVGQTVDSGLHDPISGLTASDNVPIPDVKQITPNLGHIVRDGVLVWNDVPTSDKNIVNDSYNVASRDSIEPESHVQNDVTSPKESTSAVNVPYEADGNGDHNKVLKGDSVNSKRLTTPISVNGAEQQLDSTTDHVAGDVSGASGKILEDTASPLDHTSINDKNLFSHDNAARDSFDPELPVHNNVTPPTDTEGAPNAASVPYEADGNGDHNKVLDGDSVNAKEPQTVHDGSDVSHPGPNFVDATQTSP